MFKFCSRKGREFQRYPPCLVTLSLTAIKSLTQHTLIVKCRWHYLDKPVLSRAHQVLLDIPLLKFGGPGQYLYKISIMFPRSRSAGAIGNDFMQVWTNLCYRECFCKTPFWNFPPKFEPECAEPSYVMMTHQAVKANLEKGFSWPPEAIPYGLPYTMGLVLTQPISPTPWTRPQTPHSANSPGPSNY